MNRLTYNEDSYLCLGFVSKLQESAWPSVAGQFDLPSRTYVAHLRDSAQDVDINYARSEYPTASSTSSATSVLPARMPTKRSNSESPPLVPPAKLPKTEQKSEDFSTSVKKRLATSSRTGQACDRCKIRKIRCDGLPGGCSPCLQNQTECRTTDRITGRAAPRGYVEGLESQNGQLQNRVQDLERLLIQHGIDVKSHNGIHVPNSAPYNPNVTGGTGSAPTWSVQTSSANGYPPAVQNGTMPTARQSQETNIFQALPFTRTGFSASGENYLGVSSEVSDLTSIKGTSLSILGMEIDIADFPSDDMDEPDSSISHLQLYNKSYQSFLQSTLNTSPKIDKVDLPPREEGIMYAQWYFRMLQPFLPVLHKPTFMKVITRMYDDSSFRPTHAQIVMVHMVFAIMIFQISVRNREDKTNQASLNHRSNLHYHYSLGMYYHLMCSRTLEDVQAMTLLCAHLRNFPKPGASWTLTAATLGLAIELGMHRSEKIRLATDRQQNPLEIEIRKRTFWSLMAIHVTLSGKLGRPVYLRMDDFDVEVPDSVDDELLSENGLDTSRAGTCMHEIAIASWKLLPVFMELYATIYATRRNPETYKETVHALNHRLRQCTSLIPDSLLNAGSSSEAHEGRVFGLYVQVWICEFKLLLHHPSTSMTQDPAFNAESMRVCVESARKMLSHVVELQGLKSLDTTWYNSAVYVMAITTTLFAQWEKRMGMTPQDLDSLRKEMDTWLGVMGDIGLLLGSGTKLQDAVRNVTDGTLGLLSHSLQSKSVFNGHDAPKISSHRLNSVSAANNGGLLNAADSGQYHGSGPMPNHNASGGYVPTESNVPHQQTPYPTATQYSSYPEDSASSVATYPSDGHHNTFSYPSNVTESVEAPLLAAFANQAVSQIPQQTWPRPTSHHGNNPVLMHSGSQSWQQWTSTVAGNLEPQDCYSANALMSLGGRDMDAGNVGIGNPPSQPMADMTGAHAAAMAVAHMGNDAMSHNGVATWPLNIFDVSHNGQGQ